MNGDAISQLQILFRTSPVKRHLQKLPRFTAANQHFMSGLVAAGPEYLQANKSTLMNSVTDAPRLEMLIFLHVREWGLIPIAPA